jgi:bifunctional non-homologous end joining protein LigD
VTDKRIVVDGHIIAIGHAEKIFFPEDGLTKWDMVEYYKRIAPVMLPHMQGRPVTMLRMTDGIYGESFYHKETPAYFPDWIKRAPMAKEDGVTNYVICDSAAALAYLADQACVTPHLWLSRFDRPHYPDLLIFDLDPSGPDFEPVREAALVLRILLTELGLPVYVKTTGSRGVHVVSPLDRNADFDTVRTFAEAVARYLADMVPENLTVEQRKEKRKGRVFIDTLRNSYAQTAVAPYALRARPGAPVAAPITWEELKDPKLRPQSYTMKNIFKRLARVKDPWAGMWAIKAGSIDQPWKKLKIITGSEK